jgi:hypothetical protein
MSIYTYVKKEVVDVLDRDHFCGTYVLRMEPIYAEVSEQEWYDAMERGEPIDQVYEVAEQQKRYWIWGPDITRGIVFEILDSGDLFTANRGDAIYFAEFLIAQYGMQFYRDHVGHDNDSYWDPCLQQWVGIALDSGAMYTPLDDVDSLVQSYCDEQQGDITVELDVIYTLNSHERLDGKFDVVELMSDGNVRMVTKDYDPLGQYPDVDRIIGGDVFGHHVDRLLYVTDDSVGRLNLVIIDSGEIDEGNGLFTWVSYVKGVCDPSAGFVQFYIVYEDDLGRISETFLFDDDPRIAKCSYVINIDGDIPF